MPFSRDPRRSPRSSTEKLAAPPTSPLESEPIRAFGQDQFTASPGLRSGSTGQARPSRSAEEGLARIRELHEELARAKATVLEVRPRMAILKRALRLNEGKISETALFQHVAMQEKVFTKQVARHVASQPEAARTSAVAINQWETAWEVLRLVEESLNEAEMGPPEDAVPLLAGLSVEKMRGQVFPLTTLYVHFEADAVLSRLFPPPHLLKGRGTGALDPRDVPPQGYTLGDLFKPTVRRVTDLINKMKP